MKKKYVKILITVLSIVIVIFSFKMIENGNNIEDSGTIQIIVIDENNEQVINENINYSDNQTLKELLELNFYIEDRNGFLLRIGDVYADGDEYFLKIYVNNEPSLYGIEQLPYDDADIIKFVYTKVGDYDRPH